MAKSAKKSRLLPSISVLLVLILIVFITFTALFANSKEENRALVAEKEGKFIFEQYEHHCSGLFQLFTKLTKK